MICGLYNNLRPPLGRPPRRPACRNAFVVVVVVVVVEVVAVVVVVVVVAVVVVVVVVVAVVVVVVAVGHLGCAPCEGRRHAICEQSAAAKSRNPHLLCANQ